MRNAGDHAAEPKEFLMAHYVLTELMASEINHQRLAEIPIKPIVSRNSFSVPIIVLDCYVFCNCNPLVSFDESSAHEF